MTHHDIPFETNPLVLSQLDTDTAVDENGEVYDIISLETDADTDTFHQGYVESEGVASPVVAGQVLLPTNQSSDYSISVSKVAGIFSFSMDAPSDSSAAKLVERLGISMISDTEGYKKGRNRQHGLPAALSGSPEDSKFEVKKSQNEHLRVKTIKLIAEVAIILAGSHLIGEAAVYVASGFDKHLISDGQYLPLEGMQNIKNIIDVVIR